MVHGYPDYTIQVRPAQGERLTQGLTGRVLSEPKMRKGRQEVKQLCQGADRVSVLNSLILSQIPKGR